ncbi:DHA2 family efflux MFS transporter permease subunit [Agrobacterium fabrum]|uniref:DHA2 family efflux MFS transporter permease subunit n=1 Tax=Agrobacterium fabrum TaxID=1176649 RepID=UPI0015729C90|nr:DHA2 family efflux MFS transporter permease subunit [Agrobacterium fabrum]WCK80172.1 DHA2 family efflux MFS transporter permease subunit [Agrobacterium fabrum]
MSAIIAPLEGNTQNTIASDKLTAESKIAISVLFASTFTVILNEMLMGVALPTVMADLGITASTGQWLTTAYMLTMAVVIPATGFLTERFRMRTVYTLAMSLFTLGTMVAIAAPGFEVLLIGRIIQAVGTAIATPLAFTAVTALVPPSRAGRMMALLTVSVSTAPAFGPAIAGAILSVAGWRWLFVFILPVAVIALVVGNMMIRVPSTPRKTKVDGLSILLSAIGFASLVYGLASFGEAIGGNTVVSPWTALGVGIGVVALFVARQLFLQKSDRALLDMRPFSVRSFAVPALLAVFFMTAATGMMTLMPVILQASYGLTPLQTGLFMLPGGLTITVISVVVGRYYDRLGARPLMVAGAIIDGAGLFFMSTLAPGTPIWLLLTTYMFIIVGQAFLWTPTYAASLGALNKHLLPHGSAIMNTIQQLSGAAGIAIAFSIMTATTAALTYTGEAVKPAMAQGAQHSHFVGFLMVALGLVVALIMPKAGATKSGPIRIH